MRVLYKVLLKTGALSLLSKTFIIIWDVPDFGGFPPSNAVTVSVTLRSFSLSNVFTPFLPTSRSNAPMNPNFPPGAVLSAMLIDCSFSGK
uniref:Uncharacterized protein n=1 Tax=Oryzias sinensis TaxID=183150 RepID=A0A8C7WUV0_9TELE